MRLVRAAIVLLCGTALFGQTTPQVPRPSPNFHVQYPNGGGMNISTLKGKVVALLFVHTTCPHCQRTSQVFSKLFTEYGPRGFQPVDVAFNDMSQLFVNDFVRDFNINYPVGFGSQVDVLNYLGIPVMERYVVPQIVWIDKKGVIRSQTNPVTGDDRLRTEAYWREEIETLLKEPASETTSKPAVHRQPTAKKSTP